MGLWNDPGVTKQEERKEKVEQAAERALKDLMDGRKEDIAASQQEAKREMQRLEQALAGQKPADEKAQELARRFYRSSALRL